ncbi:MAG TPA: hypothetical protein VNZ22_06455, partial [Bacillota bacterium]|nr:hypothetical protein [Bacillota bacterium]
MKAEGTITTLARTLKLVIRVALVAMAFTGAALAQSPITLTFENLQPGWSNDYGGLQWTNFSPVDGAHYNRPSGYKRAVVSPDYVVLNAYTRPAELTKSDGPFNLLSAYLTGAWNDRLQVQVAGFHDNTLMYSNTYVVNAARPTLVHFDYLGVNRVVFSSTGGVHHANFSGFGTHFAMDNLTIRLPGENPAVIIQSPGENARLTNGVLTACGNAADNVQVAAVWYRLNHADWTLATGTIVWTASDLVLTPGTNVLSACAVDLDGNR